MARSRLILWVIFGVLAVGLTFSIALLLRALVTRHTTWWDWFLPMLLIYTMVNEWRLLQRKK
ncbi:hypothetical protein [Lacticaseibacillus hulanensis]|jgi:flagellar biosynthesis component FlhA|uniref:hypothetical protein n=1 Tax=Lacticaseibacillus hulanensis TaxID=2493111 RepID=UPI000FDB5E0F|nr:hypothetical protein [Lacticaseibacillus hulanensis]